MKEQEIAVYIGVDWGDERNSVHLQAEGGAKIEHFELEQKPDLLHEWVAQLRQRSGGRKVAIAIEQRKGAVIHALAGEQDLRGMGGLKKDLPITYWTFLVGALAIAGVPGLAGFFSKDEILFRTFSSGHTLLWTVGLLTSLLTAIYMFRLVYLAFHGPRSSEATAAHDAGTHGDDLDANDYLTFDPNKRNRHIPFFFGD
jgi:hypothetical protein